MSSRYLKVVPTIVLLDILAAAGGALGSAHPRPDWALLGQVEQTIRAAACNHRTDGR